MIEPLAGLGLAQIPFDDPNPRKLAQGSKDSLGTVSQEHPNFPTDDHFHIILSSSCRARYVCLSLVSSIQAPPPSLTYVGMPVRLQAKDGDFCTSPMGLNPRSNKQTGR